MSPTLQTDLTLWRLVTCLWGNTASHLRIDFHVYRSWTQTQWSDLRGHVCWWRTLFHLMKTAATDLRSGPAGSGTSCSWLFQDRSSPGDPCQSSPLWGSRCSHGSDDKTTPQLIESLKRRQIQSLTTLIQLLNTFLHVNSRTGSSN